MLADFGFSKRNTDVSFVRTPRLMGTHGYTSPKYLLSGRLAEYANIYAYEVVLYELLSGKKLNCMPMIHHEARTLLILSLDLIYILPCYN
ncbi:putative non-specific serine/threonine protein kinase [Helianthus debilis subsp. tardiflorus]